MPKIEVSDAVLNALRERAEPFVDRSPNDVLERLLDVSGMPPSERRPCRTSSASRSKRVLRNHLTRHDLAPVVVQVLSSMGGECHLQDVLEFVEIRIKGELTEFDKEILPKNNFPRWGSETRFARELLIKQGLLESGGRGIWRLTDQGRLEAAELAKRGGNED